MKTNNILNDPYFQGIVVSAIWWIITTYVPKTNVKAGNKSKLLFSLAIILFVIPISSLANIYINSKPLSLFFLLLISGLLPLSFVVGIIAINFFRKEKDLYSFIKATRKEKPDKILDQNMIECICTMRKAFHEIELEFNKHFERGYCTDPKMKNYISVPGNPIRLKSTTILEFEIYSIYQKHIMKTHFYDDNIISDIFGKEKFKDEEGKTYRWVLDPIDGGYHFLRNIPLFTTCVALQRKENNSWITHFSAIYIPLTKELFFAVRNNGAYLNNWDCRLPLERKKNLAESIFYFEFPNKVMFDRDKANNLTGQGKYRAACDLLEELFPKVGKVRGFDLGSFGLAYVAKGSFEAYFSLPGSSSFYDCAAGILLVEESVKKDSSTRGVVRSELMDSKLDEIEQGARIFATSECIYNELFKDKKSVGFLEILFPKIRPLKKK